MNNEELQTKEETVATVGTAETKVETKEEQPNVQELMLEIATLKRKADKASSEAADYKKKLKASMTEQEQASMERAEAQAARDAELEDLKKELKLRDGIERYMDLGMTKELAKKAATAEIDGDSESLTAILKQQREADKKSIEQEFYKKMPQLSAGTGEKSVTKEQFDAMGLSERTKLFRENRAEYDRLMAM